MPEISHNISKTAHFPSAYHIIDAKAAKANFKVLPDITRSGAHHIDYD